MPTASAVEATRILRDASQFEWYIIPLFAFVVYIYSVEIEKKNWSLVFAGLAFWGMDWFNEIWNSLVFHFTDYAPVWGAPAKTAYLILIGLNIEISFMFAVAGIAFSKMLFLDKSVKILIIPNRLFFGFLFAVFCVFVEVLLNKIGALTWDYPWWSASAPTLIILFGYFHFFVVSFWVFDMESVKKKAITTGIIYGVDVLAILVFGVVLRWL